MYFIKLTATDGSLLILRADTILVVQTHSGGSKITLSGVPVRDYCVTETVDEVWKLLCEASDAP
jgi:hypothetical protein